MLVWQSEMAPGENGAADGELHYDARRQGRAAYKFASIDGNAVCDELNVCSENGEVRIKAWP